MTQIGASYYFCIKSYTKAVLHIDCVEKWVTCSNDLLVVSGNTKLEVVLQACHKKLAFLSPDLVWA